MTLIRKMFIAVTVLVITAGVLQLGQGVYIKVKAVLAQHLLAQAWAQTQAGENQVKPWVWADTWPLARMVIPSQDKAYILLAGDSGRTLAFGPGHHTGSPLPGEPGNSLISGHRDTHFSFLQHLVNGDEIILETISGERKNYQVEQRRIMSADNAWVIDDETVSRLTFVTCYPFNALQPGTPLRYVITAVETNPEEIRTEKMSMQSISL